MIIDSLLFIAGLLLLVKGADWLVDGASGIARKSGISDLVIGLTVVAFGTSAPELFVNLYATLDGDTDIAIGNIIGSNIANILLILGVSTLILPLKVKSVTVWKEIPLALVSALVVAFMILPYFNSDGNTPVIDRAEGLTLIMFFAIFLYYAYDSAKKPEVEKEEKIVDTTKPAKYWFYTIIGLVGLVIGSQLMVDSSINIATVLGVPSAIIGLTIVAVGTSLPELATSINAARKGNSDIAIGNVVGSNIFNIFWILGLSATITDLPIPEEGIIAVIINLIVHVLLFAFLFLGKRHELQRWQGFVFLVLYVLMFVFLV